MIEPRVSVPMGNATSPALRGRRATRTPPPGAAARGPADDPLELLSGDHGLRAEPPNQTPPRASAPIDSFAQSTAPASRNRPTIDRFAAITAPASRNRSTLVASTCATRFSYGFAPQVVLIPLVSNRSFTPNGMPCSGPRDLPALISLSAAAACASARSSVNVTTQCSWSPYFFSRARYIFVRSVDETL